MIEIMIGTDMIEARGHGKDETGCAIVSAMLYALAGGLENVYPYCAEWEISDGYARICIPKTAQAHGMRVLTEVGLEQVARRRDDVIVVYADACAAAKPSK